VDRHRQLAITVPILLIGLGLRLVGLTRGDGEPLPSGKDSVAAEVPFYHFHPDERTLIRAGLELTNPLQPQVTAYGTLPMYLARGAVALSWLASGAPTDFESAASRRAAVYGARILAVLISCLTLWLTWRLGLRVFPRSTTVLAVFLLAVCPMALQQAHFFTVDGVFTLLVLASLSAGLSALESRSRRHYALAGMLIGATAAVRLNGVVTGVVLGSAHLLWGLGSAKAGWAVVVRRRLAEPSLWVAGAAGALVLLGLQPYLMTVPELLARASNTDDFAYSVAVARGEILRPWSLVDVHTVPYLHFWRQLLPLGTGWPLTVTGALGCAYAAWKRGRSQLVMLAWLGVYFALVGGLHTKHVRYLFPMLPLLCLLAADIPRACWHRSGRGGRLAGGLAAGLVAVYTGVYGLAFARIYVQEDSRLVAARWLRDNVSADAVIGVEGGGFSMRPLLDLGSHRQRTFNTGSVFATRGYLGCEAARRYMRDRLEEMEYIAIVDVNRYQQYVAAPEVYPAAAAMYERLTHGRLGFDLVQRFRVYPSFMGWTFRDDGAEPSFTGYDHPTVLILKRTADFEASWEQWQGELRGNALCADMALERAAEAMRRSDWQRALEQLQQARQAFPDLQLVFLLEAEVRGILGQTDRQGAALQEYSRGYNDDARSAYLLPWASAMTLTGLGLEDLAVRVLGFGVREKQVFKPDQLRPMANSYVSVANLLAERGKSGMTERVYVLSTEIWPEVDVCNALAGLALADERHSDAVRWWRTSLELDEAQLEVHRQAGKAAAVQGDVDGALFHLSRAVELDHSLSDEKRAADYHALADLALRTGRGEMASELRTRAAPWSRTDGRR